MPPILDRCVRRLRDQGVGESSAFAICTVSLQRAGLLPRGRGRRKDFDKFAEIVGLPSELHGGMKAVWSDLMGADVSLLKELRKIRLTDIPFIFGKAKLHSKVIHMNPAVIQRVGGQSLWYGATAIHEAQHAVHGFGEHEATRSEQRYTGKVFGVASKDLDRQVMTVSTRAAVIAQRQREHDVHRNHRFKDFQFLTSVGYSTRVARKIIESGRRMFKRYKTLPEAAKQKDFYEIDDDIGAYIQKAVDIELIITYDEFVEKGFMGGDHATYSGTRPYREEFGGLYAPSNLQDYIERYVRQAIPRKVGIEARGPLGILPVLRRKEFNLQALSSEWKKRREKILTDLIPEMMDQGLFKADGDLTDAHLLCVLHAWSPVPERVFAEPVIGDN